MRKIFTLLIVAILATATSWAAEKTILLQNIGESASGTLKKSVSQVTVKASGTSDSYTLNYLQGKKQGNSIFLAQSTGAFISNKTPIPGEIKSIKVYINKGASGKTTYYCAFTSSECFEAYNQGCTAVNIAGGKNHTFTNPTDGATYFCISLGNANNVKSYLLKSPIMKEVLNHKKHQQHCLSERVLMDKLSPNILVKKGSLTQLLCLL